jgi:hypothetical protein
VQELRWHDRVKLAAAPSFLALFLSIGSAMAADEMTRRTHSFMPELMDEFGNASGGLDERTV